jgi:hypothetical protein
MGNNRDVPWRSELIRMTDDELKRLIGANVGALSEHAAAELAKRQDPRGLGAINHG